MTASALPVQKLPRATPILGVNEEQIAQAEAQLGLRFPEELREAWKAYNRNELRGGWRLFPIFNPADPRKTSNHVVYENTKGRWQSMAPGLVAIADNGTGNHLVLPVNDGRAQAPVLYWDHETCKTRPWKPGLAAIVKCAAANREGALGMFERYGPKPTS